jgi:pilus biogenesis lipoprotein CpaD
MQGEAKTMSASISQFAAKGRVIVRTAALLGLLGFTAACETMNKADRWIEKQVAVPDHQLPKEQTDIAVRQAETSATVVFAPGTAALSRDQRILLSRFIAGSGAGRGDRAVIIVSPAAGRGLTERRAQTIAAMLRRRGLNVARTYAPVEPDGARVSISRLVAVPPNCPHWDNLMVRRMVDEFDYKFGCLDAASLATTVHRPHDLVQARPHGPSDGPTLDKGLQNLREGKYDPAVTATGTGSPQSGQSGQQGK